MSLAEIHLHTTYCDGKDTPEDVIRAAIQKGLSCVGFSGHSYTPFDQRYCMTPEGTIAYRQEIARLKERYAGRIEVLCGIEYDYYSELTEEELAAYDYRIGSVHYIKIGSEYLEVDETPEFLRYAADRYCGGDIYTLIEHYYNTVSGVVDKTNAEIIGHFDLIAKFNEKQPMFDEEHPRYIAAYTKALDRLISSGRIFEINTGAIANGYRTVPYPTAAIVQDIASRGGRFILTGDTHAADSLCYEFNRWQTWAQTQGATLVDYRCVRSLP